MSTTSIATEPTVAPTSTVYETVSIAIPSTIVSAVTVGVTTVVVKPATSTITSTLKTAAVSTATATTTGAGPTQTGKLVIKGGPRDGYYLTRNPSTGYLIFTATAAGSLDMAVVLAGGRPYLAGQPTMQLYLYNIPGATYGVFTFLTPVQVTASHAPITCAVHSSTGYLDCSSSNGYYTIFQCATYMYMAASNWVYAGCTAVNVKLVA